MSRMTARDSSAELQNYNGRLMNIEYVGIASPWGVQANHVWRKQPKSTPVDTGRSRRENPAENRKTHNSLYHADGYASQI